MSKLISLGAINKTTGCYVYPRIANKKDKHFCPDCDKELVLCQGTKRVHHFRHKVDSINQCNRYNNPTESQIHKDAKMLLKHLLENKIQLYFERTCEKCNKKDTYELEEISKGSKILLEHRFEYNGLKIADVAYLENSIMYCIFEICNTHKTCDEHRPEPWFEINANTLINIANDNKSSSIIIPCMRCIKCDECNEIENSNLIENDVEKYVRIKLGQTIFPTPEYPKGCKNEKPNNLYHDDDVFCGFSKYSDCNECGDCNYGKWYFDFWKKTGHLRFDFDARDENIEHNKQIIELFYENFNNYKIVIHSHKGGLFAYVINKNNYKKYNYWEKDNYWGWDCPYPCEHSMDCSGQCTIQIICDLIEYCKNLNNNVMHVKRGIDIKIFTYLKVEFSRKDLIKGYGGKWNNEHKLWYIKNSIYYKNKSYIDEFVGDKINFINNDCDHCNGTGRFNKERCWFC